MCDYHHSDQILKSTQGHSLFIGDVAAAQDLHWLKQHNIRTVITAAVGFNFHYEPPIRHIRYELEDKKNQNISQHFEKAAALIEKNLRMGSVLVHCGAGVSRSPTLVIAYMIRHKSMNFLSALKYCKLKRPQICPNLGFELQLKAYEKMLNTVSQNSSVYLKKKLNYNELPQLTKYQPNQTFHKTFIRQISGRSINSNMSKSLKHPQVKEKKDVDYLCKMAQFRFGVTNMQRWKISLATSHKQPFNI